MVHTVAVVEDRADEAETLKAYFTQYAAEHGGEFKVIRFESGEQFLEKYNPIYDLVLLDIGLPGRNGMETAALLREQDETVTLIFVTNMAQFAVRGYEVGAFDFVVKPVTYANFALKLQRALSKMDRRRDAEIVVSTAEGIFRVSASRLKYIEISGHKMVYHTVDGPINAYGNLKDVETVLNPSRFVRCNSCYLVNLSYVQAVRGHLAAVDGEELQISRPRRKPFIQALNDFLGGGIS